jgi:cytochrome c oxidase cbb3-type subunit I/II
MWRAFTEDGNLAYQFIETVTRLMPFYWVRVIGGTLYLVGAVMLLMNLVMTWKARPKKYEVPVHQAPALAPSYEDAPIDGSRIKNVPEFAHKLDVFNQLQWHRRWERLWVKFTVWTFVAIAVASLFEIIPTFLIKSNVATIETVTPYTPLELAGRDIYVAEGCYNCHSQMIRPIFAETELYGEYSKGGEFVYDHPFQWGSRRIGPDLHRVGTRLTASWHFGHFIEPKTSTPGSIMPSYVHFVENDLDFDGIANKMIAMQRLGVPYSDVEIQNAAELARIQAGEIMAKAIEEQGPDAFPAEWETKDVIAITAYLLRLGTDLSRQPEAEGDATDPAQASTIGEANHADG